MKVLQSCPHCPNTPYPTVGIHANLLYRSPLSTLIHTFKYHPRPELAATLATYMWHNPPPWLDQIDAMLPMPLSTTRLRSRGFNQAHLLAKALSHELGIPILEESIIRRHTEQSQVQSHVLDREKNAQALFTCKASLQGKRILIIDDVITTGATVRSLGEALLSSGASAVYAWVLARATC